MAVLDGGLVNVSLPTFIDAFNIDAAQAVWLIIAWLLSLALCLVSGWVFVRRRRHSHSPALQVNTLARARLSLAVGTSFLSFTVAPSLVSRFHPGFQ